MEPMTPPVRTETDAHHEDGTVHFHGLMCGPLLGNPHQTISIMTRLACIDALMRDLLGELERVHPSYVNEELVGAKRAAQSWRAHVEYFTRLSAYTHERSEA